jgi:energy-coupling factor transporter ATP-binding protein EcfA2
VNLFLELQLKILGMNEVHSNNQFVKVEFRKFKAFERFTLNIRHFNILVGPNNAGKSTILAAFRILSAGLRKAASKKPVPLRGPDGDTFGYNINLEQVSVAEENIFYNYDDSQPATVTFTLSNGSKLVLFFPEKDACYLLAVWDGSAPKSPSAFLKNFSCSVGFVPILGPVEHNELLYQEGAARRALFNYTASRNFRNIWFHFPEGFEEFRRVLKETWPGMDVESPKIDASHGKPRLHMFCPERRIPREIFWAGFGFQVWCQMLTHLLKSEDKSIFLIDEPDIYLHAELQRQLLGILRNLGPDILIATHSTEIITEAEPEDIILVNKDRMHARRIKQPSQLTEVFSILGSNLNPVLTQLAKTRRVIFVEGKDFQIISKFAKRMGITTVSNRSDFAVVAVEGFNPERIKNLKRGMETTLGGKIVAAAILDRDFRSDSECRKIESACQKFCEFVQIHNCKEIENFLLVPSAIDRALTKRIKDRSNRLGKGGESNFSSQLILEEFCDSKKHYVNSQLLASSRRFEKAHAPTVEEANSHQNSLAVFEERWSVVKGRFQMVGGKDALSYLNQSAQELFKVSITPTSIIDAMRREEIPEEMGDLVRSLKVFTSMKP